MSVFRQLGDPVGEGVCLCQHHGVAYAEFETTYEAFFPETRREYFLNNATILSAQITTTERCCINVTAATVIKSIYPVTSLEIERPLGTIRTTQEDQAVCVDINLLHHAAWEVLDPGTYSYFLVNRSGITIAIYAAWLKIIASDCEG